MSIYLWSSEPSKIYVWSSEVSAVFVGTEKVRPAGWTPWSNTVCYYPFDTDTLDATWNTTISWSLTKDGLWYRPTANWHIDYPTWNYPLFLNYWLLIKQRPTSNTWCPMLENPSTWYYPYHSNSSLNKKIWTFYNSSYSSATVSFSPSLNTWHNLSLWYDGTKMIYSIDGVSWTLYNWQWYNFNNRILWWAASWQYIISNFIAEKTARTEQERLNYYNLTKSNYWL